MKPNTFLRSLLAMTGSAALAAPLANAATITWDPTGGGASDGTGTWTNAGEWWDGGANVDWSDSSDAIFGNGGAGGTVTVGTVSAGSVLLDDFTGTYTLQGTSNTLTQSGGITIGPDAGNVIFKGTGAAALLTIDGVGGITMNGSNLLNLSSNLVMIYTGPTVINSGVVMLGNASNRSTGNFTLNGGMLTDYYRQTHIFSSGLGTGDNQIQIHGESGFGGGNGTSSFRIGANNSVLTWGDTNFDPTKLKFRAPLGDNNGPSIYGQVTLQNRLDLNGGTRTIDVYRSGANVYASSATISGGIQDTGGTGSLIKTGNGTLILATNTSTWGGNTTVSGGILDFGGTNIANIGGGSGRNISVAAGAVVKFNTLSNAILQRIVETSDEFTVMTGTTSNALDFSGSTGANLSGAFLSNYAGNGAKAELSGIITPGGGAYRLGAPEQNGALGIRQESLLSGDNQLIIGGNRVVIVGAHTFTGDTTIRDGGRLGLSAYTGLGTNSLGLQNSVLDLGAPSATGRIFLEAGNAGGITGFNPVGSGGTESATFGGLMGSRDLYSAFLFTSPGNNTSAKAASAITGFTLNTGTGVTVTYSGAIGGFGAGASGATGGDSTLTKTGAGTQILSGTSTYTGATTVSGGALAVNGTGSINNSSGITVATGAQLTYNSSTALITTVDLQGSGISNRAVLGGSGTIGVAVTLNDVGDVLAPGNSPGVQTFTANQIWSSLSYDWELNNWVDQVAGTNIDQVAITGMLDLTGNAINNYYLNILSMDGSNAANPLSNFTESNNSWTILTTTGGITGFDASYWNLNAAGFQNTETGTWSLAQSGSDLVLSYTVIPEPSVALLGALGLLTLICRRAR